jgi:hypothetical protein
MLASPGNIHYNPWWNWRRLAFAMPDLTIALFLLTAALLLVGVVKLVLWLTVRATLLAAQPAPTAA